MGLSAALLAYGFPRERQEAARDLGLLEAAAMPAVPALLAALQDHDPRLVEEAVTALGLIGGTKAGAAPVELEADARPRIAIRAAAALRGLKR